jgi:hypothetical protein
MAINIAKLFNFPFYFIFQQQMNFLLLLLFKFNIFKFLQQVFSHKGLKWTNLQELNIVWQVIGFLYGIIGVGVWGVNRWSKLHRNG